MKRTLICSAIMATAFLTGTAYAASTVGGTVNFEGDVVAAACSVDTGSINQTIEMGQVRTSSFKQAGDTTQPIAFAIKLTGCDTPTANPTVSVGFMGATIATKPEILALTGGASAATGLGIQILNSNGTPTVFDGTPNANIKITGNDMTIPFQASYISTATPVTAGSANASATFALTYQ